MALSPRKTMALFGALQGFLLWVLTEQTAGSPASSAAILGAGYGIGIGGLVVHMARSGQSGRRLARVAVATGAGFALVAAWVGWQLPLESQSLFRGDGSRSFSWVAASFLSIYALLPFIQTYQETGRWRFPYPRLFEHSWNNFLIGSVGLAHALAVALVFALWGALFDLIGIDFFEEVFEEEWFVFTVGAGSIGYGLVVGRDHTEVLANLRDVARKFLQAMSVVLAVVSLTFLASTLATGLDPLFATQSATTLLINWLAATLLCFNAAFGSGQQRPEVPNWITRIIEAGVLALPVLGGIAGYALQLRIGQYGFSPGRVFALSIVSVLGLYAACYAAAVLRRGTPWLPWIARINTGIALLIVAISFALHSPLLDPIGISLRSQLSLLERPETSTAEFEYDFLRFVLGQEGYEALQTLQGEADPGSVAAIRIAAALDPDRLHGSPDLVLLAENAFVHLDGTSPMPPGLSGPALEGSYQLQSLSNCGRPDPCLVFQADIVPGGSLEWIIISNPEPYLGRLNVFGEDASEPGGLRHIGNFYVGSTVGREALEAGDWRTLPHGYNDLEIGTEHYDFVPE